MRLSQIKKAAKRVAVDVGDGEILNIEYDPNVLTPELESWVQGAARLEDSTAGAMLAELLERILLSWDLFCDHDPNSDASDDAPRAVATDAATLKTLPTVFLDSVARAVLEDLRPNPPSVETSGSFS
jgi:hypothetical protein